MSYVVGVTIYCDEEGCSKRVTRTSVNAGGMNKTYAGYLAANDGWAIPGGTTTTADPKRAWCPDHAAGKVTKRGPRAYFRQDCVEHEEMFYSKTAWQRHQREAHR